MSEEFIAQLMMFRKQEAWIVREFRKLGRKPPTKRERAAWLKQWGELMRRAEQWVREYVRFLEDYVAHEDV